MGADVAEKDQEQQARGENDVNEEKRDLLDSTVYGSDDESVLGGETGGEAEEESRERCSKAGATGRR